MSLWLAASLTVHNILRDEWRAALTSINCSDRGWLHPSGSG
jgi:hypothetical protein